MFYIKGKKKGGKTTRTDITDENVFTRCPECGRELAVNLAEVFSDGEGCLFSTNIICSACTRKRGRISDMRITLDGLALLVDVLRRGGYDRLMGAIFSEFDVTDVNDLAPKRYGPFAETLCELIVGILNDEQ